MHKIAIGITGSFCNHKKVLSVIENFVKDGYEIVPVFSESVYTSDTRFFKACNFKSEVERLCNHEVLHTIVDAEKISNTHHCEGMIILPCTANTMNKLANGIYDGPITLAAKSLLRNDYSVVLALASNDGLSNSLENIGKLMKQKNIFFVPFTQDDYIKKPSSLVCDFDLSIESFEKAVLKEQIQPVLLR